MPAGALLHIHVVEADTVDPEFRHARGHFFGIGVGGKIGAEGEVHAEEADALVAGEEMAVLHRDGSRCARRAFQPRR